MQSCSLADMKFSIVVVLLHGGGMYNEQFSCGGLIVCGEPLVFFSSGNVVSLCDSSFIIFYEKESI
jgi:hypothetical protein